MEQSTPLKLSKMFYNLKGLCPLHHTVPCYERIKKKTFFVLKCMRLCSLDRTVTDQHRRVPCTERIGTGIVYGHKHRYRMYGK